MFRQSKLTAETVEARVINERGEAMVMVSVRYRNGFKLEQANSPARNLAVLAAVAVAVDECQWYEPDPNLDAYVVDRERMAVDHEMVHEHIMVAVPITR